MERWCDSKSSGRYKHSRLLMILHFINRFSIKLPSVLLKRSLQSVMLFLVVLDERKIPISCNWWRRAENWQLPFPYGLYSILKPSSQKSKTIFLWFTSIMRRIVLRFCVCKSYFSLILFLHVTLVISLTEVHVVTFFQFQRKLCKYGVTNISQHQGVRIVCHLILLS